MLFKTRVIVCSDRPFFSACFFCAFTPVKPNLQVFRAKFSEITPNSIRRACETLTEPDRNISDAVDVRQELDLRIGTELLSTSAVPYNQSVEKTTLA